MSPSSRHAQRRMRVGKVERRNQAGDFEVWLTPDTSERVPAAGEVVIYGVSVIYRGVEAPQIDDRFEVTIDVS
ncbi:MAG TPA: hypothetical protein VJT78_02955 [Candidatus Dormibacteraeota bacterium]|nr:hypothetical protein [Candidatus Dormibacteraeota bacterium]